MYSLCGTQFYPKREIYSQFNYVPSYLSIDAKTYHNRTHYSSDKLKKLSYEIPETRRDYERRIRVPFYSEDECNKSYEEYTSHYRNKSPVTQKSKTSHKKNNVNKHTGSPRRSIVNYFTDEDLYGRENNGVLSLRELARKRKAEILKKGDKPDVGSKDSNISTEKNMKPVIKTSSETNTFDVIWGESTISSVGPTHAPDDESIFGEKYKKEMEMRKAKQSNSMKNLPIIHSQDGTRNLSDKNSVVFKRRRKNSATSTKIPTTDISSLDFDNNQPAPPKRSSLTKFKPLSPARKRQSYSSSINGDVHRNMQSNDTSSPKLPVKKRSKRSIHSTSFDIYSQINNTTTSVSKSEYSSTSKTQTNNYSEVVESTTTTQEIRNNPDTGYINTEIEKIKSGSSRNSKQNSSISKSDTSSSFVFRGSDAFSNNGSERFDFGDTQSSSIQNNNDDIESVQSDSAYYKEKLTRRQKSPPPLAIPSQDGDTQSIEQYRSMETISVANSSINKESQNVSSLLVAQEVVIKRKRKSRRNSDSSTNIRYEYDLSQPPKRRPSADELFFSILEEAGDSFWLDRTRDTISSLSSPQRSDM